MRMKTVVYLDNSYIATLNELQAAMANLITNYSKKYIVCFWEKNARRIWILLSRKRPCCCDVK